MSNQTFINLGPYWDVIHRHRGSFFSTLATGMTITALALVVIPKEYTARWCWKYGTRIFNRL